MAGSIYRLYQTGNRTLRRGGDGHAFSIDTAQQMGKIRVGVSIISAQLGLVRGIRAHEQVDDRTKRFDKVIGKIEVVEFVLVMDT